LGGGSLFFISPGTRGKSAYCNQVRGLATILQQNGVSVVTTSNTVPSAFNDNGVMNYPAGSDPYFSDIALEYFKEGGYNLVITLMDTYRLSWMLKDENKELLKKTLVYAPIDFPIDEAALAVNPILMKAPHVVVPSKWAYRQLSRVRKNVFYIPHGVIPTYRPVPLAKPNFRRAIGLPEDTFVVGSVAVNLGERKNLPGIIEAFSIFAKTAYNAYLYMHTDPSPYDGKFPKAYEGLKYDLPRICRRYGVHDKVLFPEDTDYKRGQPEEAMAWFYSAFDVFISMSYAEAFCLPLYEAQSCGTPVIAPDNTAQTETVPLVDKSRWLVPTLSGTYTPLGRPEHQPYSPVDIRGAVKHLIYAWRHRATIGEIGNQSRVRVLQFRFDKVVKKYWLPLLNKLGVEFDMTEDVDLEHSDARLHGATVQSGLDDEGYLEDAQL